MSSLTKFLDKHRVEKECTEYNFQCGLGKGGKYNIEDIDELVTHIKANVGKIKYYLMERIQQSDMHKMIFDIDGDMVKTAEYIETMVAKLEEIVDMKDLKYQYGIREYEKKANLHIGVHIIVELMTNLKTNQQIAQTLKCEYGYNELDEGIYKGNNKNWTVRGCNGKMVGSKPNQIYVSPYMMYNQNNELMELNKNTMLINWKNLKYEEDEKLREYVKDLPIRAPLGCSPAEFSSSQTSVNMIQTNAEWDAIELEDLPKILETLPQEMNDDRKEWMNIIHACKEEFGKSGKKYVKAWSKLSDKYNEDEFDMNWNSQYPKINIGYVLKHSEYKHKMSVNVVKSSIAELDKEIEYLKEMKRLAKEKEIKLNEMRLFRIEEMINAFGDSFDFGKLENIIHEVIALDKNKKEIDNMIMKITIRIMNRFYRRLILDCEFKVLDVEKKIFYKYKTFKDIMGKRAISGRFLYDIFQEYPDAFTQYDGIEFQPNPKYVSDKNFNVYSGRKFEFANLETVERNEEQIDYLKEHIYSIICREDKNKFEYITKWMANKFRKPWVLQPALAIYGEKGTGKSIIITKYMELFKNDQTCIINDVDKILGRFNDILQGKLVIYLNEALFGTSRKDISKFRSLITEKMIMVERKGIPAFQINNFASFIIDGNNQDIVRQEKTERRFIPMRTSDKYGGYLTEDKREYFKKLANVEIIQFAKFLYDIDLEGYNPWIPCITDEMTEQQRLNFNDVENFAINMIEENRDGYIPNDNEDGQYYSKDAIYNTYSVGLVNRKYIRNKTSFWMQLSTYLEFEHKRIRCKDTGNREYVIKFSKMLTQKEKFNKIMGGNFVFIDMEDEDIADVVVNDIELYGCKI